MSGHMDDERFDVTLRAFLAAEAERASSAAPPVGETLVRLREAAGPPSRRALVPAWLLIVIALLLTAALVTSLAVGSGLLKLSVLVPPSPSPTGPAPQRAIGLNPANGPLQSGTTYGFALAGSSVGVEFTVPADALWEWNPMVSPVGDTFVSGSAGGWAQAGRVGFALADDVYADPCHRRAGVAGIGPGVDDLIAGLQSSLTGITGITLSAPRDATIGGMDARVLTIRFGVDFAAAGCDLRSILLWHEPTDQGGIPYARGGTDPFWDPFNPRLVSQAREPSIELFVLDVGGTRVLIEVDPPSELHLSGTSADLMASIRFTDAASEPSWSFPNPSSSPVPVSAFSGPTPLPGGFLIPQLPSSMWVDPQHRVGLELTVPEPLEWRAHTTPGDLYLGLDTVGLEHVWLEVAVPSNVHRDACNWQSAGVLNPGSTVDELTQALRQSLGKVPGAVVTEPVDAMLGTLHGLGFTFTAPDRGGYFCDSHTIRPLAFLSTDEHLPAESVQFSDEVIVLDVHGTLVVVVVETAPTGGPWQILDSIRWK